jgi:nucleotide-binding universal stress UspA family protein
MGTISKILIAYDGSECSDAALDDLKRAGLPGVLKAVVVTLADVVPPFTTNSSGDDPGPTTIHITKVEQYAHHRVAKAMNAAHWIAQRAATRLGADFPSWDVHLEVRCDAPQWSLVKIGDQDPPDLIIVGSHRHFVAGGRLILGRVSQRVLYEARCSVRVARCSDKRENEPVRLVIGFNGTPQADAAVDAVLSRIWPEATEVRIVSVGHPVDARKVGETMNRLRAAHLATSYTFRRGKPAHVLARQAEEWRADSIFLGTNNLHGYQHLLHGSIAATVAARAQCSVEVVRPAMATRQLVA